jgi:hypothetical protein
MPPSRQILAPATPEHGGEAGTSRLDDEDTLIELGSLQVRGKTASAIGKTTKTDKGPAAQSIASNASTQGSKERTKRTRGDSNTQTRDTSYFKKSKFILDLPCRLGCG